MSYASTVEFVPLRNDLANLPNSLASLLFSANIPAQEAVIEIQCPHGSVYCGWTGLSASNPDNIELDPAFATNLGLQYQQHVKLSVKSRVPVAHTVLLEPVSVGDWEIVETHVAFLEAFMINQVRAISLGKLVTVFPSSTSLATLKVMRIEPDVQDSPVARLSPECEVIIAPRTRQSELRAQAEKNICRDDNSVAKWHTINTICRATVHPFLPNLSSLRSEIHGNILGLRDRQFVLVGLAVPNTLKSTTNVNNSEDLLRCHQVVARYLHVDSELMGLSYGLQCALGVKNGVGIQVSVKSDLPASFPAISATVRPYTTNTTAGAAARILVGRPELVKADCLSLEIVTRGQVVAPHPTILPMGGIIDTDSPGFGTVEQLKLGAEMPLAESQRMELIGDVDKNYELARPLVGQDTLLNEIEIALLNSNGVLLYGSRGCGKSVVLKKVANQLATRHVRGVWLKCSNYSDKAVSTVRETLRKAVYEALWSSPSVILMDDLDKLSPVQQEHTGDSNRQQQIAELVSSLILPLIESGKISVLATAQDQSTVHSFLLSSHTFDSIFRLKSPDKNARELILRTAIDVNEDLEPTNSLDLLEVVAETEGYQPGDLWVLVERLSLLMASNDTEYEQRFVTASKILAAVKDFVPASLRGVKLETPSVNWNEIGGMDEAKRIVLETLEWPTKYAPIFANCPLRLRSGLLFYGYPGCGKTMLASAIASKTGLNFISVKGPEILNKYIGASEKSVRDLFERAQAAKPCVLFFDEFDSIAPKRGHDATGVTDRVVNQLLTQMDGAEGLDGVYVLAATSRPDLIDSALLRPGRLDKSILCDMPNASARLDILQKATKKLNVQNSLDLKSFADKTIGFSGADVQALVYNAYLKGVHTALSAVEPVHGSRPVDAGQNHTIGLHVGAGSIESSRAYLQAARIDNENPENQETAKDKPSASAVVLGVEELNQALQESKPSISPQEAVRFRKIYSEFCTDRNGEMPPGTSSNEIGGRVTLQ